MTELTNIFEAVRMRVMIGKKEYRRVDYELVR